MINNPILITGLLLLFSFLGGRTANRFGFPRVTGYLCAGILINPSINPLCHMETVTKDLHVITEVALGIIAYSIGGSLELKRIRHLGNTIGCISVSQAAGAALVSAMLIFIFLPTMADEALGLARDKELLAISIVLGAISAATAPGAVLAIVSELKSRGEFTSILLGVIAIDDAITIIFFAVASVIAQDLIIPAGTAWFSMLLMPVREIGIAVLIGGAAGYLLAGASRKIRQRGDLLMVVLGGILLVTGFSEIFHTSRLLSAMTMGITVSNIPYSSPDCFNITEIVENTIFGLFFALADAYMDLKVITTTWFFAGALLVFRMIGKHLGTWAGAKICGADDNVRKYLSLALFPQAGVTIGLVLMSEEIFPSDIYTLLLNAVIGSVVINEIIAPPLVKFALEKVENSNTVCLKR